MIATRQYAAGQILGERREQQDAFAVYDEAAELGPEKPHLLLLLADGMGGHVGGAVAGSMAVQAFMDHYRQAGGSVGDRLRGSLEEANGALAAAVRKSPELSSMGCTLVGVTITDAGIEWVSVGDSPLWLLGKERMRRLNADHSLAPALAAMVEAGKMTAEEAAADRRRHILQSAVMGDALRIVDQSSRPVLLRGTHDKLILASDGLETLSDGEIASIAIEENSPRACVNLLLDAVQKKAKRGQDNTSVVVFAPNSVDK